MASRIFAEPNKGWRRPSDRQRQRRKAASQLDELLEDRGKWATKYAVVIQDRDGRQDFRLFQKKWAALRRYNPAAQAAATNKSVLNGRGIFSDIAFARVYEVDCDEQDIARSRIDQGRARLIAESTGTMGAPDLFIEDLFQLQN
jgi:hypothetical protein